MGLSDFGGEPGPAQKVRVPSVMHGVIADAVPLGNDAPGDIGKFIYAIANAEKCGGDVMGGKPIQDESGCIRIGPVIKGKCDLISTSNAMARGGEKKL